MSDAIADYLVRAEERSREPWRAEVEKVAKTVAHLGDGKDALARQCRTAVDLAKNSMFTIDEVISLTYVLFTSTDSARAFYGYLLTTKRGRERIALQLLPLPFHDLV